MCQVAHPQMNHINNAISEAETLSTREEDYSIVPEARQDTQEDSTQEKAEPPDPPDPPHLPVLPKTRRGTNPVGDALTTRFHVLCVIGVLADLINGGYDNARAMETADIKPARPTKVDEAIASICPWVIDVRYLNLEGSSTLAKKGLKPCFKEWAANRLYYFTYGLPTSTEHPAHRRRGLKSVYKEFYDTFVEDIKANQFISEDRARAFWLGVSNKVVFRWPDSLSVDVSMAASNHEEVGHEE